MLNQDYRDMLSAFGAPLRAVSREDFETPDTVFQIGVSPRRIDLLTTIEGVQFDEAWPDRLEIEVEDVPVSVIGRDHFIQNRQALGRSQDRADVERLRDDENG